MKRIICLVFIAIFITFNFSYAAFWDNINIPIPADTKELDSRSIEIAGAQTKITIYKTTLSADEVLKFYQEQLPKRGWSEDTSFSKVLKAVELPEGVGNKETATGLLQNTVRFKNNDYALMINIMPRPATADFTLFTATYGKEISSDYADLKPAKPMDFAPVYPQAKNLFSGNNIYVYTTQADINEVLSFYKYQMLNYGWKLTKETPINESNMSEVTQSSLGQRGDLIAECLDCEKEIGSVGEMMKDMSVLKAGLKYEKHTGQMLDIEFMQPKSTPPALGTQITIRLNEK